MGATPREKYQRRLKTFTQNVEAGEIDAETAERVKELCNAFDADNIVVTKPSGESHRKSSTLKSWVYRLSCFALERNLTTATVTELKQDIQDMHKGKHPTVNDEGIKQSTLRSYQAALRKFYSYHDDLGIESGEIPLFDQSDTHINPSDMLSRDEINQAREVIDNPRDLLIFDLLINTGQRREALVTLRVKDVDYKAGTFRLNHTVEGLKGASDNNGKRPLLGAKATVRDWVENYHPDPQQDHYLITQRPNYARTEPTEHVAGETIRRVMSKIKKESGISKPMNPHAMRHNFVTICSNQYEIDPQTIKYLIGHDPDSTVMETTYSHLSGDDHVATAEEGFGLKEPEPENSFVPDNCRVCGAHLQRDAKACGRCGTMYTPDAREVSDQIDEAFYQSKGDAETDEAEEGIDTAREILQSNPDLKAELIAEMKDELKDELREEL